MVVKSHFVSTTQTNDMLFKQCDKRKGKRYVKIVVKLSYQSCRNFDVKCKKTTFVLFNITILFNLYLNDFLFI